MKPCDPHAAVSVVWHRDPAVDEDRSDIGPDYMIEAVESPSIWRDKLVMREGAEPVEWVIGVVPPSDMNYAESMPGGQSRMWYIFLRAVRDIRGNNGLGEPKKIERDGVKYVDPEWLAKVMAGPNRRCALDLGLIAYRWQDLAGGDLKNS